MVPREKWTDERLDDLNERVDRGFADVRAEMRAGFARVDGEIKDLRQEMNDRFNSFEGRFTSIDARFDALNRNLIGGLIVLIAAIVGSNAF